MNVDFIGILLTFVFAGLICVAMLLLGYLLGPKKPGKIKKEPFECGIEAKTPANMTVYVKFYVIAMLFILFDIEIIFFYPWAIVFNELNVFGIVEMLVFVLLMLFGYVYIIRKGVFQYNK